VRVAPILAIQERWSRLPRLGDLLIESTKTREGHYVFLFPFEGRSVHEGLATLVSYRMGRESPRSAIISVNDYGFQLLSPQPFNYDEKDWRRFLSTDRLVEDLLGCLNSTELARRQFREIARVAGLVFQGFPGMNKSARQLQASSELFFDVLVEFDPANLLLDQARREVLERELEVLRLRTTLERMAKLEIAWQETRSFTPLSFPLWAEFIRGQVTSERWTDRVQRMAVQLEAAAAEPDGSKDKKRVQGRTNRAQTRVYG
jgi:ATP-dependent Lhr-like helicase